MMSDIDIPPAALEAGARAMYADWIQGFLDEDDTARPTDYQTWDELDDAEQALYFSQARAAFLAMVEAWPGMHTHEWQRPWLGGMSGIDLILPLTEKQDAEA